MGRRILAALGALLLMAAPASAWEAVSSKTYGEGKAWTLCNDQDAAGICDTVGDGTGESQAVIIAGYTQITVYLTGTFTSCQLYSAPRRAAEAAAASLSGVGLAVGAAITPSTNNPTILNLSGHVLYADCTGTTTNFYADVEAQK